MDATSCEKHGHKHRQAVGQRGSWWGDCLLAGGEVCGDVCGSCSSTLQVFVYVIHHLLVYISYRLVVAGRTIRRRPGSFLERV